MRVYLLLAIALLAMFSLAPKKAPIAAPVAPPGYDTRRLNALLARDACVLPPCDLASGTTVGGAPIGGGGAPTGADYLVGTVNGSLSSEIVVGTSPGGELGGTWASPTLDDNLSVTGWQLGTLGGAINMNSFGLTNIGPTTFSPAVDTGTYSSPFGPIFEQSTMYSNVDGEKTSGAKTKVIGSKRTIVNLTQQEAYGDFVQMISGGDTDTVAAESDSYCTGGAQDSGDEGCQSLRNLVQDFYYDVSGNLSGSLASGSGTTSVNVTSLSETESQLVGENKLMVFTTNASAGAVAQDVNIVTLPPGTINASGTETAGWSTGTKTWEITNDVVASSGVGTGWCFASKDSSYTDDTGTAAYLWLKITGSGAGTGAMDTIDTESIIQGVNHGLPRGYLAATGTNEGMIAPCVEIDQPTLDSSKIVTSVSVRRAAGFDGTGSNEDFVVSSYPNQGLIGAKFLISQVQGSGAGAVGVEAVNRLETNRGRYQGRAAFDPDVAGSTSNLKDGNKHGWLYGLACDTGDCEAGVKYDYVDIAGNNSWLAEIDMPTARWTTTPETFTVVRTAKDQTRNLTLHPVLGWGQFGDPFARTSQLNTPNGSGPTTSSSGRLVEWSQIEGMPAGFQDGSDDGSSGGATDLHGLTDVTLSTPATGASLIYDGAQWIDGPIDLADADARTGVLPDANVADNLTCSNYLPLAGGNVSGSIILQSGAGISVGSGAAVAASGTGLNIATSVQGSGSTTLATDLATAEVSGILGQANGGLGVGSLTQGGVLLGSGSTAVRTTGVLAAGQLLIGDGTTDPTIAAMSGDATMNSGGVVAFSTNSVDAAELVATGVSPGTYQNAIVTVDADGRVTAITAGSSILIGSGTKALSTSAIAAGACNTDTITAAGVVSTDVVAWSPNADLSTVNGFRPFSPDGLAIYPPVPGAGSITVKTCNPTGASITPGAVSLNWRVAR